MYFPVKSRRLARVPERFSALAGHRRGWTSAGLRDLPAEGGGLRAELGPLEEVGQRRVERALSEADHLRTDADPALVQDADRVLVARPDLAEDARVADPNRGLGANHNPANQSPIQS